MFHWGSKGLTGNFGRGLRWGNIVHLSPTGNLPRAEHKKDKILSSGSVALQLADCTGFCTDCLHPAPTADYWPSLGGSLEVIEAKGKICRIRSLDRMAKVMASDGVSANSTTSALYSTTYNKCSILPSSSRE